MLSTRKTLEEREQNLLAKWAIKSAHSKGRQYKEGEDEYRTIFQRDRDRVIHSKAFRRLKGKTQVFIARYGDHYRSRLTHTMEVAQLSRDMARTLNLNEDLAETIALSHDLGHTPFGHSGQDAMHEIMQQYGGRFEHNEQSRRVVELLEHKKAAYSGLNLSYEVRDGLIKHRTFYDQPLTDNHLSPSLEAQVVNIADEIAYLNHDIEDGIRSGILKPKDFESLAIWQEAKEKVGNQENEFFVSEMKSALIKMMVNDLTNQTDKNLEFAKIKTIHDIYELGRDIAGFSDEFYSKCKALKIFLYDRFYHSNAVKKYNKEGQDIIHMLFEKLIKNFNKVPSDYRKRFKGEEKYILVKDYIAGMTDHFAIELYEKLK